MSALFEKMGKQTVGVGQHKINEKQLVCTRHREPSSSAPESKVRFVANCHKWTLTWNIHKGTRRETQVSVFFFRIAVTNNSILYAWWWTRESICRDDFQLCEIGFSARGEVSLRPCAGSRWGRLVKLALVCVRVLDS